MGEPLLVILGPTATGKSWLGLELARRLGGEILSGDALQVYRGLDIGTAKPSIEERRLVRHHLIDILEPWEPFSAGEFARRARAAIREIRSRGALPIVVGGSGLYVRALLHGISDLPEAHPGLRRRLRAYHRQHGIEALRGFLRLNDPEAFERLAPGDSQRILRALEVAFSTGRPLTTWVERRPFSPDAVPALKLGLTLPRGILYDRIAARVLEMLASGWVDEVERLMVAGLDYGAPAFQAIGYRQLAQHLQGKLTLEQAVDEIVRATRRFAKRQLTWFRTEPAVYWIQAEDLAARLPEVLHHVGTSGIGRGHGQASDQHPRRLPVSEPQGGP
jgi:tRNA dimethylallyltransferase